MTYAIDVVKAMYTQATNQLPAILAHCANQEEKDEVWAEYYALRENFDNCVNQKFAEDDPDLAKLKADADASAQEIAKIDEHLDDIVKVLATLSDAVGYGIKIAGKIVAA